MNLLDWSVIAVYSAFLLGLGYFLGKSQTSLQDYYLGGRNVKWWHSGLSTMATQLGAISFISAPAFVAIQQGGGLKWIEYEFGVPLAMIFLMLFIIPVYHRAGVTSIYEYLDSRFDSGTRTMVSVLFQISRGLATAVAVLAIGIVISTALDIPLWLAILSIGAITIVYDVMGGIRVVIISDVIQMMVILAGILIVGAVAYDMAGGWGRILESFDPARLRVLNFEGFGWGKAQEYSFWPMVIGGFFLYASYYGCDQSQVQRELSVGNLDNVRRSLLLNAVGRFPLVLLYCFMGVFIGAFAAQHPEFIARIPSTQPDRMVPLFVLSYLPNGVIGFIFVAILAAAMSSLDSALNSMSASLNRDIYQRYFRPEADDRHYMLASKLFTAFWGVFVIGFAFLFANTQRTTIEAINMVGSVLYGPILAAFFLGIITRWATAPAVKVGVASGIIFNLLIWQLVPELSWLWWNATGFICAVGVAGLLSALFPGDARHVALPEEEPSRLNWPLRYAAVGVYFLAMVVFTYLLGEVLA